VPILAEATRGASRTASASEHERLAAAVPGPHRGEQHPQHRPGLDLGRRARAPRPLVKDPEMSEPLDPDSGPARERILAAAEELFAELGFDATPTSRIAERAGVPKGLVHYYFTRKPDLLSALVERVESVVLLLAAAVSYRHSVARHADDESAAKAEMTRELRFLAEALDAGVG
jgi:AcrR family transcriptional regulator